MISFRNIGSRSRSPVVSVVVVEVVAGVAKSQLAFAGVAEKMPLAGDEAADAEDMAANRRAELHVLALETSTALCASVENKPLGEALKVLSQAAANTYRLPLGDAARHAAAAAMASRGVQWGGMLAQLSLRETLL